MKLLKRIGATLIALALFFINGKAQTLSLEKTYEITGKANRGYLGNINIDEANNVIELTYVTKANETKAKFETYQFDTKFNFIKVTADEIEFEKASVKYTWFKYKGENYSVEAVSVEGNLMGTLVLKRKLISYKWNWFWGGYDKYVKLLEKLKPKSDEGNKYYVYSKAENDVTGDVVVLVGEKAKIQKGSDPYLYMKKFHFLRITKDLDIVQDSPFDFENPQVIVKSQLIAGEGADDENEDASASNLGILFAPAGGAGFSKAADTDAKHYTFVSCNPTGVIDTKVSFTSGMSVWGVNAMVNIQGSIVIFGPSKGDEKYFNQVMTAGLDPETLKWDHFQIMKITNGQTAWINSVSIDEFENKLQTPPTQKKSPAYKGKKFAFANVSYTTSGDIFIMGQNFSLNQDKVRKYEDPLMFQFDNTGRLKAQYGVHRDENNKYAEMAPCAMSLIETNDNKSAYWMIAEIKGLRTETELGASKYKMLVYPSVAKINIGGSTIGDFAQFGQDTYYLNNRFMFLPIDEKNSIVFFGETKNGRTLWFGKMPVTN